MSSFAFATKRDSCVLQSKGFRKLYFFIIFKVVSRLSIASHDKLLEYVKWSALNKKETQHETIHAHQTNRVNEKKRKREMDCLGNGQQKRNHSPVFPKQVFDM